MQINGEIMLNSLHYFNPKTQQIYRLKSKGKFSWFINKNAGKYFLHQLLNLFVGLRILLVGLGIWAFLL
jgi:hypothetical protein